MNEQTFSTFAMADWAYKDPTVVFKRVPTKGEYNNGNPFTDIFAKCIDKMIMVSYDRITWSPYLDLARHQQKGLTWTVFAQEKPLQPVDFTLEMWFDSFGTPRIDEFQERVCEAWSGKRKKDTRWLITCHATPIELP